MGLVKGDAAGRGGQRPAGGVPRLAFSDPCAVQSDLRARRADHIPRCADHALQEPVAGICEVARGGVVRGDIDGPDGNDRAAFDRGEGSQIKPHRHRRRAIVEHHIQAGCRRRRDQPDRGDPCEDGCAAVNEGHSPHRANPVPGDIGGFPVR